MSDYSLPKVLHNKRSKNPHDMANIDKKSKKAPIFGIIFYSTSIPILSTKIPPTPISQQRKNLAELSYLELDYINYLSLPHHL